MIWYHIKIFFRNFRANAFNSIVKTLGLTVGLISLYFIFEYTRHENSYDKNFNNSDRIFRVIRNWQESEHFGSATSVPFLDAMKAKFPQIVCGTRLVAAKDVIVINEQHEYTEESIGFVDSSFFQTFNMSLIDGNTDKALTGFCALVISKSASKKYFGEENPIGKKLVFEGNDFNQINNTFTVTGVFNDLPVTCHMHFDLLLSIHSFRISNIQEHRDHCLTTYLRLHNPTDRDDIEKQFPEFMSNFYGNEYYTYARSEYRLEPIEEIHGNTHVGIASYETPKGNNANLYIFPVLGMLILLIASINFVNLSVGEGKYKSISFGINRLSGAGNYFFFRKFILESSLFAFLASLLAMFLIFVLSDSFRNLVSRPLELRLFSSLPVLIIYFVFSTLLGVIIGLVPSFIYASKSTITYLKGNTNTKGGMNFSALSQIVQFSICIMLFAGSMIVFKQLSFISNKIENSLDNENVLLIKNPQQLGTHKTMFKQEVLNIPGITNVSLCIETPAYGGYSLYGYPIDPANIDVHVAQFRADKDYLKTFGIKLLEGRFFDEAYDDKNSIVLNETAIKTLGWDKPIGKRYSLGGDRTVIGVIEDIHFESLYYPIIPQGILLTNPEQASRILIKLQKENVAKSISQIQNVWTSFVPNRGMESSFLNSEFEFWYTTERKTGMLALILSAIAIFLSSLGLLGMVLNTIQTKIKEIGIRKVNGAKILEILGLLNRGYVIMIIISLIISIPLIYYLMNKWLTNFAYKTDLIWWVFILAGLLVLGITLLTVSWQSWRAAKRNPVEALKYE